MGHPSIIRKGHGTYSYLHRMPVWVCQPQTMLSRARGVGSNQDCLSILTWRERELNLCKRRGTWTRGKGVP